MDDWEALADAELKDIKVEKASKFDEEEDTNKNKEKVEKVIEPEIKDKGISVSKPSTKKKSSKKEEPVASNQNSKTGKVSAVDKKTGEQLSKLSDLKNTVDLFEDFIDPEKLEEEKKKAEKKANATKSKAILKSEEDYLNFAVEVALQISESSKTEHMIAFIKELLDSVSDKFTSYDYDEIVRKSTVLYNSKQKEEKPKAEEKPALNISKRTDNLKQYNDLMGDEEFEGGNQDENFDDGDFM